MCLVNCELFTLSFDSLADVLMVAFCRRNDTAVKFRWHILANVLQLKFCVLNTNRLTAVSLFRMMKAM